MNFDYTGRSSAGAVAGVLPGASADAVADALMARGVTPLKITLSKRSVSSASSASHPAVWHSLALQQWLLPRVQPVDLLLFSRQMHKLLKSGVPILRALAGLQESAPSVRMQQVLQQVRTSLGSGLDLSTALARQAGVFDSFYVALVRVGEVSGRLDDVFLRLFHHIEFEISMRQQIRSAVRYPLFVLAAMAAGITVINVMVIPAFAAVFSNFGADLPLATRLLMATSALTISYGWPLSIAAVAGIGLLRRWKATPSGRLTWDRLALRLPLSGTIIRKGMLARFARSFALSLKSGVPAEQALSLVARTVENAHIATRIDGMRQSVERGESILRAAAAAAVFTPMVLQMIAVGEETGAVDEMMDEVADLYTSDVQYELKTLGQQIEPIMVILLGVMVLVLALGVFLPIWDLGRVVLKH